jgi:hypothetical protein
MSRPLPELIKDYEADPSRWEVIQTETEPSTNRHNQGGTSVQELLKHRVTGEEMTRHTLLKLDGKVFRPPHFRPAWK